MSSSGEGVEGGHALHMRAINAIRRVGGISAAVQQGIVTAGIMHALVMHGVPFVLAGSIRDDGPLPEVLTDTLAAQDAMRQCTAQATFAVFVATALHAIAETNTAKVAWAVHCRIAQATFAVFVATALHAIAVGNMQRWP